jgi:hypothetical protein
VRAPRNATHQRSSFRSSGLPGLGLPLLDLPYHENFFAAISRPPSAVNGSSEIQRPALDRTPYAMNHLARTRIVPRRGCWSRDGRRSDLQTYLEEQQLLTKQEQLKVI